MELGTTASASRPCTTASGRTRARLLALLAALLALPSAAQQVKIAPEVALPTAAISPVKPALSLTASALSLAPSLSAPSLSAAPTLTSLTQTGSALSAAIKDGRDTAPIALQTFDGARAAAATPERPDVSGKESPVKPALEPFDTTRFQGAPKPGFKTHAIETAEVAAASIPFALVALFLRGMLENPAVLIPAMAGLWGLAFWVLRSHLGGLRSTVVGGWQASHDQKYRTDPSTGLLKDIRGHKYGSDRYEEYAAGPVGRAATAAIAAAVTLAAAGFLLL